MPQPWHSQLQKCDPVTTYFHSFGDLVVDSNRFNEQECEPRVQNWKTVRRKMTLHMPTRGLHWAHPKGRCKQDPGVAVSILSTQWLAVPPGSRELGFHARLQLTSQSQEALRTSGRLIRCLSLSHQGRGRPSCTPASTCPFLELAVPGAPLATLLAWLVESLHFGQWELYAAFSSSTGSFNYHCFQRNMHTLLSKL